MRRVRRTAREKKAQKFASSLEAKKLISREKRDFFHYPKRRKESLALIGPLLPFSGLFVLLSLVTKIEHVVEQN